MPIDTEQSFREAAGPPWRAEPFRLFFPLGVVFSWVGVSHWLLYALSVTTTYSCEVHGFIQMQAFMMSFAVGFLFTALPRRTRTEPPAPAEMFAIVAALLVSTGGALAGRFVVVQLGYAVLFLVLLQFAVRRFIGRGAGRRPPAAFVLIPFGVLHGLAGALLIGLASAGYTAPADAGLGRLLVEQGVFLCFVIGIGSLILPLMGGSPPPPDLGSSPRETRNAVAYAAAGLAILSSFVLEHAGWTLLGPLLRAGVVALGVGLGGAAWRPPDKPGFHRRLVWLSVWSIPVGLVASALLPDLRIAALHIVFIGGFAMMAFGVATHVSLGHLGLESLGLGRPPAVVALAAGLALALMARLAADWSESYFAHLGWAAACWIAGSAVWLVFLGPHFLRPKS